MPPDLLRVAAFCAYLAAWVVFVIGAAIGAAGAMRRQAAAARSITAPAAIGALLQVASALALTLFLPDGPLRPTPLRLAPVIALAPGAAALFVWSLRSAPRDAGSEALVTTGAYAALRHPMYLAFLGMLLATGLLVSTPVQLAAAAALYLAGTELRVADEDRELRERHGEVYEQYCGQTRWRYLPGIR